MFFQLVASHEGVMYLLHDFLLFGTQSIGILGVEGGEESVVHLILLAVKSDDSAFEVDAVKHAAVVHVKVRSAADDGGF